MSELSDILSKLLNELAEEIKSKLPHASGATANAIQVTTTNPGNDLFVRVKGELTGPSYIRTLEDGRGPTKRGKSGSKTLQESILEWIKYKQFSFPLAPKNSFSKAIKSAESLSWAIAIKIHKEGNQLYRDGGKSGVLSTTITDARIENFVEVFNSKASRILLNNVVKTVMA